jgi:hypothetical protein
VRLHPIRSSQRCGGTGLLRWRSGSPPQCPVPEKRSCLRKRRISRCHARSTWGVIVHLRVRDVTLSECLLQAPYGRFAVVLGDTWRYVVRHEGHLSNPCGSRTRLSISHPSSIRPSSCFPDQIQCGSGADSVRQREGFLVGSFRLCDGLTTRDQATSHESPGC